MQRLLISIIQLVRQISLSESQCIDFNDTSCSVHRIYIYTRQFKTPSAVQQSHVVLNVIVLLRSPMAEQAFVTISKHMSLILSRRHVTYLKKDCSLSDDSLYGRHMEMFVINLPANAPLNTG